MGNIMRIFILLISILFVLPAPLIAHEAESIKVVVVGVSVVFIVMREANSGSEKPSVEPALKPYQPNQRMKTPNVTNGRL